MSRVYDWALKTYQRLLDSQDQSKEKKQDNNDSAGVSRVSLDTDEDYDTLNSTIEEVGESKGHVSQASLARFSALEQKIIVMQKLKGDENLSSKHDLSMLKKYLQYKNKIFVDRKNQKGDKQ